MRGFTLCWVCWRELTKKEIRAYVATYPFKRCTECADAENMGGQNGNGGIDQGEKRQHAVCDGRKSDQDPTR